MGQPQIIVSIWDGEPDTKNNNNYLGCGVCIAEDKVLTSKHVLHPRNKGEVPAERLYTGLSAVRDGGMPVDSVAHHPDRDISILLLKQPHQKEIVTTNPVNLRAGQEVFLLAYNMAESCLKGPVSVGLVNWAKPDTWEFHTRPSHGMSGGAVLQDDGTYTVVYQITATNLGGGLGEYDLVDVFELPANAITLNSAVAPLLLIHSTVSSFRIIPKSP